MRIACVIRDSLPASRADVRVLFEKHLRQAGIETFYIGQAGTEYRSDGQHAARCFVRGQARGIVSSLMAPLWDLQGLVHFWYRYGFDCVQVRDKVGSSVPAIAFAHFLKLPFVYWMSFPVAEGHASRARDLLRNGSLAIRIASQVRAWAANWTTYRLILRAPEHIFVQSDAMKSWLVKKGVPESKLTAVPMGVDTEVVHRDLVRASADRRLAGRRVIVYLGALGKARRSEFLLDVLRVVASQVPTTLLVLAGEGASTDEAAWIREEIVARNLGAHVLLTGWIAQSEAHEYVRSAEVGLSPIPRGDLFDVSSPTKVVEYLALGVPAVANDIPDQKLVIERSRAGICVRMEVNEFASAVLTLLGDAATRQAMAERGPEYVVAERSYSLIAERVLSVYRRLQQVKFAK